MNKNIFWIAPLAVMGIGIFPMPYGYYFLLRLVICVCAVYYTLKFNEKNELVTAWVFGFFALLYNPVIPINLGSKELWIIVNLITAVMFIISKDKV